MAVRAYDAAVVGGGTGGGDVAVGEIALDQRQRPLQRVAEPEAAGEMQFDGLVGRGQGLKLAYTVILELP